MERKLGSILIEEAMATLEQIIDEARALSPAEKGKLRQALDRELEQPAPVQSSKPSYRKAEVTSGAGSRIRPDWTYGFRFQRGNFC